MLSDTMTDSHNNKASYAAVVSNMAAASSTTAAPVSDMDLISPPRPDPSINPGKHPDQYWDGRRETLGSWFTEFETTLSAVDSDLYSFVVDYLVLDRNKIIIFHPGQAAQLDGLIPRPAYSWNHPAPTEEAHYDVPHAIVVDAFQRLYHARRLRDPSLPDAAPPVHAHETYPINDKYNLSLAHLHS